MGNGRNKVAQIISQFGIVVVLLVLIIISSILSENFLTVSNMLNIARQTCVISLVAFAEATLIISGMIDLSAGSCLCLTGILAIPVYVSTESIPLAMLAAVLSAMALYAVCGVLVAWFDVPPFVATLAMMGAARGAAKLYTGGATITNTGEYFKLMGQGYIGNIPIPVFVMLIAAFALWVILSKTCFGRNLYAIGGNAEAARASGINVKMYRIYAFMLSGIFVGLAGYMLTSRMNSGVPTAGNGYEGQGISAAIIGGVGFSGGTGNAWGVLAGAIVMGIISNILNLTRVDSYVQEIINGVIIVLAVILDIQTKKRSMKS